LSVYVLEVCVNTRPEGQPSWTSGGQVELPAQVAVEPDPVAVTLMPAPTVHSRVDVKLLPDTVIPTEVDG
jgi:hypothetical protein